MASFFCTIAFICLYYQFTDIRITYIIIDETHFNKNYGYTWYDISNIDVNSVYAGFSELPFGETEMKDESDYISFTVRFKELDKYFREAIQIGLLSSEADPDTVAFFDVESLCNSIQARELSKEECKEYSIEL